jgi:hypothetical protein
MNLLQLGLYLPPFSDLYFLKTCEINDCSLFILIHSIDLDSCKSNPCINGDCKDKLDGFECQCHYGFYGEMCDGNVDDCEENACENNSTCVDGASSYTCLCMDGFRGDLCEIVMGQ